MSMEMYLDTYIIFFKYLYYLVEKKTNCRIKAIGKQVIKNGSYPQFYEFFNTPLNTRL